jgi:hypothetical protein
MNILPVRFIFRLMPALMLMLLLRVVVEAQIPDAAGTESGQCDQYERGLSERGLQNSGLSRLDQSERGLQNSGLSRLEYDAPGFREVDHHGHHQSAPHHDPAGFPPVVNAIMNKMRQGTLSRKEGIDEILNYAFDSRDQPPIKCLTSVLIVFRDEFGLGVTTADTETDLSAGNEKTGHNSHDSTSDSVNMVQENPDNFLPDLNSLLSNYFQDYSAVTATDTVYHYLSHSGRFRFEYTLTGDHAVPGADQTGSGVPDYVEMAATYADSTWNYLVGSLGYPDPVLPTSAYLIRFRDFNFYGITRTSGNTTLIEVHSNFNGFPPNLDPDGHQLGALKATIAHEFKHAIQYVTNRWRGDAGSLNWVELDATMTEDVVFPTVKDYLNYLRASTSIFRGAQNGIPRAYEQATFGLFYHQRFGPEFWVKAWDEIRRDNDLSMFNAMRKALVHYEADFAEEFFMNMAWHMAAGSRSTDDFGFSSRVLYPDVSLSSGSGPLPAFGFTTNFPKYSARFYEITPQAGLTGMPLAGLLRGFPAQSIGSVAFMHDGTVQTAFAGHASPVQDFTGFTQNIDWSEVERFGLVVINTGEISSTAQFIAGTDNLAGLFLYGDVNLDRSLNAADAENLLMAVVSSPGPRATATSLLQRALADVSDDGSLSVYDAALIFQMASDPISVGSFPADPDGRGRFPAASRVFRPTDSFEPPLASVLAKSAHNTISTSAFEMRFEQSAQPDDDTLRVYVQTLMDGLWSSVFADVTFDSSLVALQRVYLPGVDERRYVQRFQFTASGARIGAIGRNGDVSGDVLALYFVPLADTTVTVGLPYIELDEADSGTGTLAITATVRPAQGVGVDRPYDLPVAVRLLPNYPNPFNPGTNIVFELGDVYRIQLQVYDAAGRLVANLHDGTAVTGLHQVRFDASGLATGLYLVRLTALDPTTGGRSYTQTQKILYIR